MNRVLVVFSDGLLSELDSARGLISRSAWIRQAVEDKLMKEAVAPLVPEGLVGPTHWSKGRLTDEDWKAFQEGAGFETPEETEVLDRMHGITPNEFDAHKAKPKRPFRCPDCLDPTPHERGDCPAYQPSEPKPKARRKKATVGDLESDEPIDLMVALKASVDAKKAAATQTPARCNRGACTGTINPISGRCLRCNQTPLKESK